MSNPESIRRRIAEEEAKLARIEKDREETLARLQELKGRLTLSESIRAASEIPFEVDLLRKNLSRLARRVHGGNDASASWTRRIGDLARLPFDRVVRIH